MNNVPLSQHDRNGAIGQTSTQELLLGIEQSALDARIWFETECGLGEVLFHQGRIVKARLGGARGQTALLRLLGISEGRYGIEHCSVGEAAPIVPTVSSLLDLHTARESEWKELCNSAPPLSSILRLTAGGAEVRDSARGIQRVILVLIDGRRTLMQILEESSFDPVEALRIVLKALDDDLAQIAPQSNTLFPPAPVGDDSGVLPRFTSSHMTPVQEVPSTSVADMSPPSWRHATLVGLGSKVRKDEPPSGLVTPIIDVGRDSPAGGVAGIGRGPEGNSLVKTVIQGFGADALRSALRAKQSSDAPRQRIVDVSSAAPSYRVNAPNTNATSQTEEPTALGPSNSATGQRRYVDRYEILLRIGRGGMGTVYLARLSSSDVGFRRLYALKLLRNHLSQDLQASKDFLDEARVAGCLHHANVVAVCDAGFHGKQPYLVMEYVEGCSFRQLLQGIPHSQPSFVIPVIIDALAGLHAAHTLQDESGQPLRLVHCDVSPENMLVGVDGTCRLSDFGMVREANRTLGATARGKPEYIAPERITGDQFDHRADIFSMGVVLWGALTGKRLFGGNTVEETLEQVCHKPIESPSSCGASSSVALDTVVLRALSRIPNERYQSAEDMLTELARVARAHDGLVTPKEIASWVRDFAGPELTQRRLAVLDASRNNPTIPPAAESEPTASTDQGTHQTPRPSVEPNKPTALVESSVPPPHSVEYKTSEPPSLASPPPSSFTDVSALFYDRNSALLSRAVLDTPEMVPSSRQTKKKPGPLANSQRRAWMLVALLALVVCIILLALSSRTRQVSHLPQHSISTRASEPT